MVEKQLLKYIMPNMLATFGTSCYVLADTFFVAAASGSNGLTALNLTLPIYGIIFAIGSMIGIGSATRYSLEHATGLPGNEKHFSNSIIWTILVSLIFITLGIFFPDTVLRLLGADDTILNVGLSYTKIVLCCAPFFMLNYTFTAFVRNDGSPNIAMAATLSSGIFNIIFDYVFMFPVGMGIVGAALATGLSPIVSMMICMLHFLSGKNNIRFIKNIPSIKKLFSACSLGIVAFVGEISNGLTTMVFNFILLSLSGNIGVAAYGIVANTALVGTALLNGVSQGLQPLASKMYGQSNKEAQKRIYTCSLIIGLIIAAILVISVFVFAELLVYLFNSDNSPELAYHGEIGLKYYFIGFLFAAINIIRAGFYSATAKSKESSAIAFARIIGIVFFAFVLSEILGMTGVWIAFPVSELVILIVSTLLIKIADIRKNLSKTS